MREYSLFFVGCIFYYRIKSGRVPFAAAPHLPNLFLTFQNGLEEGTLKSYRGNDYALNKFSNGIVYRFADQTIEITLESYLAENPGKTEQDFRELKALSDAIYLEQDRLEDAQSGKSRISIFEAEDAGLYATRPLDEEWTERYIEIQNRRYAQQALHQLLQTGILTETQRRRFLLHVFKGMSTRQIARLDGTSHQAVSKSLNFAIAKLKGFFRKQG